MSTFANLEKPPFFTAIYLTSENDGDSGLHAEAASTLVSTAMLLSGFIGFGDDVAEHGRPVKIAYWRTYHAMRAWRRTARDLLPHRVSMEDCVASEGCHWLWFENTEIAETARIQKVA